MITTSTPPKTLSVSEFKAHCTDALRTVERTGIPVQITRHGKPVAMVCKPRDAFPAQPRPTTLRDWMGSLAGSIEYAKDHDPEEPAFSPEDWEEHPANRTEP